MIVHDSSRFKASSVQSMYVDIFLNSRENWVDFGEDFSFGVLSFTSTFTQSSSFAWLFLAYVLPLALDCFFKGICTLDSAVFHF